MIPDWRNRASAPEEALALVQMGIGAIPDAVLLRLRHKHDLGIHTEMFSDRLVDPFESGAITKPPLPVSGANGGSTWPTSVISS